MLRRRLCFQRLEDRRFLTSASVFNVDGLSLNGSVDLGVSPPADATLDVGPGHIVQLVNDQLTVQGAGGLFSLEDRGTRIQVFDRSGRTIGDSASVSSLAPLGHPGRNSFADPIVAYDEQADRWLLLDLVREGDFGGEANGFTLYVSNSGIPTTRPEDWQAYFFNTGADFEDLPVDPAQVEPVDPDFPKLSITDDGYFVTSTETIRGGARSPVVYALDRAALLNGTQSVVATGPPGVATSESYERLLPDRIGPFGSSTGNEYNIFQALTPVDVDGAPAPSETGAFFLRHVDTEADGVSETDNQSDYLELFEADADFNAGTFTFRQQASGQESIRIPIDEFDFLRAQGPNAGFDHVPQPGGGFLDGNPFVISYRAQYRNFGTHESIVGNFTVDVDDSPTVGRAGIRWFELRRDERDVDCLDGNNMPTWCVHQQGTIGENSNDGLNRWIGAIAQNASGDIAIGYNVANADTSPGLRYTGRLASDPLDQITIPEVEIATGSGFHHRNNWGDYNTLVVDPVREDAFVFTGSYVDAGEGNPGGWKTRIAAFSFAGENEAPRVENVVVSSSTSPDVHDFEAVFAAGGGAGGNQLSPVQVGGANTVTLQFSEPVDVEQSDLQLRGLRLATAQPGIASFEYDPLSFTATWRFDIAQLPADQYLISLDGDLNGGVKDLDSPANALDGEWTNPLNLFGTNLTGTAGRTLADDSGDGIAGGDFHFVMTVLPGDFDGDLDVDGPDFVVFAEFFAIGFGATFALGNLNGDSLGLVDGPDFVLFAESFGLNFAGDLLILADIDGDGTVEWGGGSGDDALLLVANEFDLNGDGVPDANDLALLALFDGLSIADLTS